MNHDDALRLMAPERYLLDELEPELREDFEEHLFNCQDCALDVRSGMALLEHSKVVLEAPAAVTPAAKPAPVKAGWLAWLRPALAAPALAALLAVVGYQTLYKVPQMEATLAKSSVPEVLPSVSLAGMSRGTSQTPALSAAAGQSFLLFVDVPPADSATSYVAELRSANGALEWSVPVSRDASKDTLTIRAPAVRGGTGQYTLVVRSVAADGTLGSEVERYPFELRLP